MTDSMAQKLPDPVFRLLTSTVRVDTPRGNKASECESKTVQVPDIQGYRIVYLMAAKSQSKIKGVFSIETRSLYLTVIWRVCCFGLKTEWNQTVFHRPVQLET